MFSFSGRSLSSVGLFVFGYFVLSLCQNLELKPVFLEDNLVESQLEGISENKAIPEENLERVEFPIEEENNNDEDDQTAPIHEPDMLYKEWVLRHGFLNEMATILPYGRFLEKFPSDSYPEPMYYKALTNLKPCCACCNLKSKQHCELLKKTHCDEEMRRCCTFQKKMKRSLYKRFTT